MMAAARAHRGLRSSDRPISQATRHARPIRTYRESSTEDEVEDEVEEEEEEEEEVEHKARDSDDSDVPLAQRRPKRRPKRNLPAPRPSPIVKRRQTRTAARASSSSRQQALNASTSPKKERREKTKIESHNVVSFQPPIPSSGVIPPWTSLPYQILLQIFQYASYPLYDERTFRPATSVSWLLKTSRLCRAFAEPALRALYQDPCLLPMERAHRLVHLLKEDPASLSFNYRQKIEHISMEVAQTAAYSLSGSGVLDLYGLIYNCPRLRDLELYHQKDMSPYRTLDENIKWSLPVSIFTALNDNVDGGPTKLRSWRWSSRMASKTAPLELLPTVHTYPCFKELRKVTFVNYQVPLRRTDDSVQPETYIAEALAVLANLETVVFESSTLVNHRLLPLLPKNLRHLELINCWEITSDTMSSFLQTHGAQLRTLTLNHNQSLSLSFLEILGSACPHLISLSMNLTYFNLHSTYRDSQPLYTALLQENEVPTWPSTLQNIELIQLRNWDIPTAEPFFKSLVRSADKLTDLRRLVIKAILNESWRDRMAFRDRWVDTFERIFKRKSKDPNNNSKSTRAFELTKAQPTKASGQKNLDTSNADSRSADHSRKPRQSMDQRTSPRNRAARYPLVSPDSESSPEDDDSDSANQRGKKSESQDSPAKRRINRELEILRKTAGFDRPKDTVEIESDSDDQPLTEPRSKGKEVEHIQGMCDIVDIRIDNLRPTENQFQEADFMDSEPEGDDDWNEDADLVDDGGYAW